MPDDRQTLRTRFWVFSTYFAEGFPYTIIRTLSSLFFRDMGMSLQGLGVTSIFGLPWVLKFFWGPLVDVYGTKRRWLLVIEVVLALLFAGVTAASALPAAVTVTAALFFCGSFAAATHDIAIDGYYMETLDQAAQARFVGYRVMAYRIAMMCGTGVIATAGAIHGWTAAFAMAAAVMGLLLLIHHLVLPERQHGSRLPAASVRRFIGRRWPMAAALTGTTAALAVFFQSASWKRLKDAVPLLGKLTIPSAIGLGLLAALAALWLARARIKAAILRDPESFYAKAFLSFMDREGIGSILAFILLIRTGEYMLSAMYSPFMVDVGLKVHYGWISAGIGLPASIAGALAGGYLIARRGLGAMAMPFLLLQNGSNLVYMALALSLRNMLAVNTGNPAPMPLSTGQICAVAAVHGFDQFAGGLGTAVLMTFLMRICDRRHKAAHYAIGTGLMSVSGLYAGVLSGFVAAWCGYGYFFGISFLASVPGMVILRRVPLLENGGTRGGTRGANRKHEKKSGDDPPGGRAASIKASSCGRRGITCPDDGRQAP